MTRSKWWAALAGAAVSWAPALAQIPPYAPEFRYGVNYTFEQLKATRRVNDKHDRGQITLFANVYRPVKKDVHKVVLFSHGSTGGWVRSPKETYGAPPQTFIEFFIDHGYTIVAPMRRGVGLSTGTYEEECPMSAGRCTAQENSDMAEPGLVEAVRDTDAVIDQIVLNKLLPEKSKILLAGVSRGGFLSLVMAGRRPELVTGVLNFVGGWLSISDVYSDAENAKRMRFQSDRLISAGKVVRMPTVWIYAVRDPFYSETVTRQFFRWFSEAGGRGDYVLVTGHSLPSGHQVANQLNLWSARAEELLDEVSK
jgi:pimeloyl-ACP methyl ester carboxylesterase